MALVKVPVGVNIQHVIDGHPPGTMFQLQAGVHRMQTIKPRSGDSFEGVLKSGKLATFLTGAKVLSTWTFTGSCWFTDGQTQQGTVTPTPNPQTCDKDHPRCEYPEDVFFDNELKTHVATLAEVRPGTWYFDYDANRIYVGDNPHGSLVETSVTPYVFAGASAASNVRMQQLVIEKYASPTGAGAVNLGDSAHGGLGWELRRSEVRYNHGVGVWNDSETSTRECVVHHNGNSGMSGAGLNLVIEGNEIAYNNTCGYNPFWGGSGTKWVWTDGLRVRGNYCHHNRGPGLWTDINNIRTTYEHNVSEFNSGSGLFHEISYDAVIRSNRLRGNGTGKDYPYWTTGAGIEVTGSRNVQVYENDLEDNWQGITGLMDYRTDPNAPHGPWELVNLHVHDNRVRSMRYVGEGGGRSGVCEVNGTGVFDPSKHNRFERNHYTLSSVAGRAFFWAGHELEFPGWQAHGQDVHRERDAGMSKYAGWEDYKGLPEHRVEAAATKARTRRPTTTALYSGVEFCRLCALTGLPTPVPEFRFHPTRKWRLDYAWPPQKVALEVEGGVFVDGRHTRGVGFVNDMHKYNEAAALGWRLIRVLPDQLESVQTFDWLTACLTPR